MVWEFRCKRCWISWVFSDKDITEYKIYKVPENSLGIQIVKLIFEKEKNAVNRGKQIIAEAQESLTDDKETEQVLELIQTILLYKLSNLSREELQAMLGIEDLKETRLGKELLTEGKLEAVPEILARGFTIEAVAEILKLEVEQVRQVTEKEKS